MFEDQGCRVMFGLTPQELSREMISTLRILEEALYVVNDCNPETMGNIVTPAPFFSGSILCIPGFSSQRATLVLSTKLTSPQFLELVELLAQRFEGIDFNASEFIAAALDPTHEQLNALT